MKEDAVLELMQLFPQCFTEGKINFERLKMTLGDIVESSDEKYTFNWFGRNNTFKNIQTVSKGSLSPKIKDSVNFNETENILIEGENLEVLKLLQKSYFEKVKVIYIDPPYNTGNDFIYHDKFDIGIREYLEQTGQVKDGIKLSSNPETSGRYHSDWLSMIYPRLFVSRNLLSDDGLIFVSIDDKEVHNLLIIMNEIFGEENFIVTIIWKKRSGAPNDQTIGSVHEYILCYAKDLDASGLYRKKRTDKQLSRYKNPDNHHKGPWTPGDLMANVKGGRYVKSLYFPIVNPDTGQEHYPSSSGNWRFNKKKIEHLISEKEIYFGKDNQGRPKLKRFLSEVEEGVAFPSIWDSISYTKEGSAEIAELFGNVNIFDTSKPTALIKEIISLSTSPENKHIVLDFFAGSGSTAHAVLEKNNEDGGNRKFVCVQLREAIDENSPAYKEGFKTISDLCTERIRRAIKKITKENDGKITFNNNMDLGFKIFRLQNSNYRIWEDYDGKDVQQLVNQIQLFETPLVEGYKDMDVIYECVLKEGLSLNSTIEKLKIGSNNLYKLKDTETYLFISLSQEIDNNILDDLNLPEETTLICLDSALDDSSKSNIAKRCILKTI